MLDEQFRHVRVACGGRVVQRGAAARVALVDGGAGRQQRVGSLERVELRAELAARIGRARAGPDRGHQRRDAVALRQDRRSAPGRDQPLDRRDVGAARGAQQRRRADVEDRVGAAIHAQAAVRRKQLQLRVRIRAGREQDVDHREARRVVERQADRAGRRAAAC